ncbi:replication endonuclease [Aliivibrio fischeri]|uniref:replication endonuclease n=1 Tax=Aliivibrio fischeri TaxID=668 RepID=UPI000A78B0EC|nr:replication endonuclease [Aliivibrio fischeri]
MKYNASIISNKIKCKVRTKDLIEIKEIFDAPLLLVSAMRNAEAKGALFIQKLKDTASTYTYKWGTPFSRHFIPRLPFIVREDIEYQIIKRLKRKNATPKNVNHFINALTKEALKASALVENKFPFSDERRSKTKRDFDRVNPSLKPLLTSEVNESVIFDHHALLSDEKLDVITRNLTERFTRIIQEMSIDDDNEHAYLNALKSSFVLISELMCSFYIFPPQVKEKHECLIDAEHELEAAICRCLNEDYLMRKFLYLRSQYIEYSQIALGRVGKKKGQTHYISSRSLTRWKHKQREVKQWLDSMSVFNPETGIAFDLSEVVKRTTSDQENRRVELIVRSRGDEERAIDLGYVGVFITWTLPSKYHRNSNKWNGCTVKEAHNNLMEQWKLARANFKKQEIDWFGLRVAEPHKDGTPHAHMFIYVHPNQKKALVNICARIARSEDRDELYNSDIMKKRFFAESCDPEKGSATGYIIKYISKNINGAHMPETDAEKNAQSVQAWASTHRIKQFSQSGSKPVGLWRQFRRAKPNDTAFDETLNEVRHACDKSRWKDFCQLAGAEKLAYEEKINKYGETVKRVIGIEWLGRVIETCKEQYELVKKKDVPLLASALALKKKRSFAPWSTENNCNQIKESLISPLEKALMDVTGWSVKGVQCLLHPLSMGVKIPIDKHTMISLRNQRLVVT